MCGLDDRRKAAWGRIATQLAQLEADVLQRLGPMGKVLAQRCVATGESGRRRRRGSSLAFATVGLCVTGATHKRHRLPLEELKRGRG